MTRSLLATTLAVILFKASVNYAFSPPRARVRALPSSIPSSVEVKIEAIDGPSSSTTVLQSQSSSSTETGYDKVKIDGKSILYERTQTADSIDQKSFIKRIFSKNDNASATITSIRGANKYGTPNNSTIITPIDAAINVGVKPTLEATKDTWKRAWKMHRFMMKILHRFDGCRPTDSKLALACLWWKALSGNDMSSPVYDYQLSYDLLPPITRWIVHWRLCRWYPRLHHANVEIRTSYLDKSVANVINTIQSDNSATTTTTLPRKKIRLLVMGGGYDTRSIKLLERSLLQNETTPHHNLLQRKREQSRQKKWWQRQRKPQQSSVPNNNAFDTITNSTSDHHYDLECYELDLPEVVRAKRQLLQTRLQVRRPWLKDVGVAEEYPKLMPVDFNNLDETRKALEDIVLHSTNTDNAPVSTTTTVHTIVLFEGVMIYLEKGIPHSLLELCSSVLNNNNTDLSGSEEEESAASSLSSGYLRFADRLENIPCGDENAAHVEMDSTGWELLDWLPKPGLARHMGVARLRRQ